MTDDGKIIPTMIATVSLIFLIVSEHLNNGEPSCIRNENKNL